MYIIIVIFIHSEIILYTTFPPEQDLGEECFDTRQCKQRNPYSMCSVENKCECIDGYTKLNNTCLPGKMGGVYLDSVKLLKVMLIFQLSLVIKS